MKNFFTSDFKIKILSLTMAIMLWIYLVVMLNPEIDVTITEIPITYSGHLTLTQNNFAITNETQTFVDVKLRGPRSMLANVNKNNITAYIDLTGYSNAGTYSLPVHIRLPYEEITVLEKKPYNVGLVIDNVVTEQFHVETTFVGTPQNGYVVYNPTTNQSLIEVTGPKEIIKTIDKAIIEVNVEGASSDITSLQSIILLNSNNDVIENKLITVSPEKIESHCSLFKSKTVPLTAVLEDDSRYTVKILGNESIVILGKEEVLASINEIKTTPISAGNIVGNMQMHVPLVIPDEIYTEQEIAEIVVEVRQKTEVSNG